MGIGRNAIGPIGGKNTEEAFCICLGYQYSNSLRVSRNGIVDVFMDIKESLFLFYNGSINKNDLVICDTPKIPVTAHINVELNEEFDSWRFNCVMLANLGLAVPFPSERL